MVHESETPATRRRHFFARAAATLGTNDRLVASCLAAFRTDHGMDETTLAIWLGCADVTALHGLALCQRPVPATPTYDADLTALAKYAGCDADRLRELLATRAAP